MERSKEFFAFCMMLMLMIPTAAMTGAVPDTGQTACYDLQGNEIKPCPSKCTTSLCEDATKPATCKTTDLCERKFTVTVETTPATSTTPAKTTTYSTFFAEYTVGTTKTMKQVYAFEKRRCFKENGEETSCGACECYEKITAGYSKIACPTGNCSDKATGGATFLCPTYSYVYPTDNTADLATLKEKRGSASDDFYGQDGNYTVNASSYTKLNSGGKEVSSTSTTWSMIKDNITGLTWAMKQSKDNSADVTNPHDGDNTYTWDKVSTDFLSKLNASPGFGGFTDWKFPTIQQLDSLVNAATATASIDTASFPSMGSKYWSSTADAADATKAWYINLGAGGAIALDSKTNAYCAIAVRGR